MVCKYCNGTGTSNTCVNGTFKPCAACNGTGEITEETAKKTTNFDRITESPEALARFVNEVIRVAPYEELYPRSFWEYTQLHGASVGTIIEWLEQESKE